MESYISAPVVAFGRESRLQINSHIENHRRPGRVFCCSVGNFYPYILQLIGTVIRTKIVRDSQSCVILFLL